MANGWLIDSSTAVEVPVLAWDGLLASSTYQVAVEKRQLLGTCPEPACHLNAGQQTTEAEAGGWAGLPAFVGAGLEALQKRKPDHLP